MSIKNRKFNLSPNSVLFHVPIATLKAYQSELKKKKCFIKCNKMTLPYDIRINSLNVRTYQHERIGTHLLYGIHLSHDTKYYIANSHHTLIMVSLSLGVYSIKLPSC